MSFLINNRTKTAKMLLRFFKEKMKFRKIESRWYYKDIWKKSHPT